MQRYWIIIFARMEDTIALEHLASNCASPIFDVWIFILSANPFKPLSCSQKCFTEDRLFGRILWMSSVLPAEGRVAPWTVVMAEANTDYGNMGVWEYEPFISHMHFAPLKQQNILHSTFPQHKPSIPLHDVMSSWDVQRRGKNTTIQLWGRCSVSERAQFIQEIPWREGVK